MLETILKALIIANFLATLAIWVHITKRQNEVIADQEQRIERLFAENVALETRAIQATDFGNDFIKQPVHGEQKPVRINLTTLDKEKSEALPDWSLGFECQTDPSFW